MLLGVAVKGVAVSIERGADVGMPEDMLEHLRRHASLDTARRIGMSETVEIHLSLDAVIDYIIPFEEARVRTAHLVGADDTAVFG